MVRDGQVHVFAAPAGLDHLLHTMMSIAELGMHVEVAPDVFQLHQLGQAPLAGGLDFPAVFSQLRRDPGHFHRRKNFRFGLSAHQAVLLENAIFVDLEDFLNALED